jgi:hypothetical protein
MPGRCGCGRGRWGRWWSDQAVIQQRAKRPDAGLHDSPQPRQPTRPDHRRLPRAWCQNRSSLCRWQAMRGLIGAALRALRDSPLRPWRLPDFLPPAAGADRGHPRPAGRTGHRSAVVRFSLNPLPAVENPVPEAPATGEGRGQFSSGSRKVVKLRLRSVMIQRQLSPYLLAGLLSSIA